MKDKEKGLLVIKDLVARFKSGQIEYKKNEYGETSTRREFIDPFFHALGWDIDNNKGILNLTIKSDFISEIDTG